METDKIKVIERIPIRVHRYNKRENIVLPQGWTKHGEWVLLELVSSGEIIVSKFNMDKAIKDEEQIADRDYEKLPQEVKVKITKEEFIKQVKERTERILEEKV